MIKHRKLQKLRGIKVSRFIGFYHNVGKNFADLLFISIKQLFEYISGRKIAALIKSVGKTFAVCRKSAKVFFRVGFVVYDINFGIV